MTSLVTALAGGIIAIFIVVLMVGQLFSVSTTGSALAGAPGEVFVALPSLWIFFGGAVMFMAAIALAMTIFRG